MTDIWVQYGLGNKIQDPLTFSTRSKYQMNINGKHFHVCHSLGISSMGRSRMETVRNMGSLIVEQWCWHQGSVPFHERSCKSRMGDNAEKAERKERGRKPQTFTSCGLKIQWKENKKPVQQLIEFFQCSQPKLQYLLQQENWTSSPNMTHSSHSLPKYTYIYIYEWLCGYI